MWTRRRCRPSPTRPAASSTAPPTPIRCRRSTTQINRLEKTAQTVQKFEHVRGALFLGADPGGAASSGLACCCSTRASGGCREASAIPGGSPPASIACLASRSWMWRRYDARQHAALARFVSAHLRAQLTQSVSIGAAPRAAQAVARRPGASVRRARRTAGRAFAGSRSAAAASRSSSPSTPRAACRRRT